MARGASFQLANAAYIQFAILLPLPISQAGSLRHFRKLEAYATFASWKLTPISQAGSLRHFRKLEA
jgi:hypothetical protein